MSQKQIQKKGKSATDQSTLGGNTVVAPDIAKVDEDAERVLREAQERQQRERRCCGCCW